VQTARRGRSHWVALLAGPVLALVSFVVAYYVDPLNFKGNAALAAIPAFLLAIVILLISHNISAFREIERASAFSDRIYEAVKDYLHVTKVGSPEVAFQYVLGRLPILQEVRNTTFNLPDEQERAGEKFYETVTYEGATRPISEWTSKRHRWKDVGDARAVKRLRTIHELAERLAGKRGTGYQYRLLSRNEPQINFILLAYPDGATEVLFNWDFRNIGADPVVLLSRDRDIVEMFAVQFEHLWRTASPDHDSTATKSTSTK
jgi:hypothetical protein